MYTVCQRWRTEDIKQEILLPSSKRTIMMQVADHYPLSASLDVPVVIVIANVRAQSQHVSGCRRLDFSVAKEREPILVPISDIVIFEARLFDRLEEVDGLTDVVSFI